MRLGGLPLALSLFPPRLRLCFCLCTRAHACGHYPPTLVPPPSSLLLPLLSALFFRPKMARNGKRVASSSVPTRQGAQRRRVANAGAGAQPSYADAVRGCSSSCSGGGPAVPVATAQDDGNAAVRRAPALAPDAPQKVPPRTYAEVAIRGSPPLPSGTQAPLAAAPPVLSFSPAVQSHPGRSSAPGAAENAVAAQPYGTAAPTAPDFSTASPGPALSLPANPKTRTRRKRPAMPARGPPSAAVVEDNLTAADCTVGVVGAAAVAASAGAAQAVVTAAARGQMMASSASGRTGPSPSPVAGAAATACTGEATSTGSLPRASPPTVIASIARSSGPPSEGAPVVVAPSAARPPLSPRAAPSAARPPLSPRAAPPASAATDSVWASPVRSAGASPSAAGGAARPDALSPLGVAPSSSNGISRLGGSGGQGVPMSSGARTNAVAAGVRPLGMEIVHAVAGLSDLTEQVNRLSVKMEVLSCGHERVATSMAIVKDEMFKRFDGVNVKLDALASVDFRRGAELDSASVDLLMADITSVKRGVRKQIDLRIREAMSTRDVLLDTSRQWLETLNVTQSSLGFTTEQATDWLLKSVRLPSRRDPAVLVRMRTCVPVLRVKPHLTQAWKESVIPVYLSAMNVTRAAVTKPDAVQWLHNDAYFRSVLGYAGALSGTERFLVLVGAGSRVKHPTTVGGSKVIEATLGHVAVVTTMVRMFLEIKAEIRPARRGGIGEGIYDVWVSEVARLNVFLPSDSEEHNGLVLVDGADPMRGMPGEQDDDALMSADEDEDDDGEEDAGASAEGAVEGGEERVEGVAADNGAFSA